MIRAFTKSMLFISVLMAGSLLAQQVHPVQIGDRVRITARKSSYIVADGRTKETSIIITGHITAIKADAIFCAVNGIQAPFEIQRGDISKVEIFTGKQSKLVSSAAIGLLSGIVIGGLAGIALGSDEPDNPLGSDSEALKKSVIFCGITGVLIGGISGALNSRDIWVDVPLKLLPGGKEPIASSNQ